MEYSPPVQPSCSLFVVMRHSCDSNSPSKCGSELRTQNGPGLGREHHRRALLEQRRIRKLRSRRNRSPRVRPGLSPVQPRIWIMTFTRGIAAVTYNSPVDLEILADVGFVRFRTMPLAMVIPLASLDKGYFPPRPSAYPRKYEALALDVHPSNEIMRREK